LSKKKKEKGERKGMPQEVSDSIKQHLTRRKMRSELAHIYKTAATIGPTKSQDSDHQEFWKKLTERRTELIGMLMSEKPKRKGVYH